MRSIVVVLISAALAGCIGGDVTILTAVGPGCWATRGGEGNGAGVGGASVQAAVAASMLSRVGCPPEDVER